MNPKSLFFVILWIVACNDKPDIHPQTNVLAVYPNPASDMVYISFSNPDNGVYTVTVFDTGGDIMFEVNESAGDPWYQVNVSDEPAGTYHVVLEKNNTTITRQFAKVQ